MTMNDTMADTDHVSVNISMGRITVKINHCPTTLLKSMQLGQGSVSFCLQGFKSFPMLHFVPQT